jgi:FkbH-like protein
MDSVYSNLSWLSRPPADFTALCRAALDHPEDQSKGHPEGFGARLRALASCALDENQLIRLAKLLPKARAAGYSLAPLTPFKLGVIANSTSDFITSALAASALRHGIALECIPAAYDQAMQESLSPDSAINRGAPQAVLIALDWRGLPLRPSPGNSAEAQATVDGVLNYLRMIREGIRNNSGAICIVQSIAAPPESLFGSLDPLLPGTRRQIVDAVNAGLADSLRDTPDVLLDVAGLAETVGLAQWHSPAEWNLAKLPFSQEFLPLYAEHAARLLAALCGKSRRCLVLDLDNTLWGGVIGDDGLKGIQIAQGDAAGEAYLDFQRYILELRSRGVVLAVSSKNEDETARLPFRHHPEMLLREEHFAIFQANWSDKATNIQSIAQELSLGLDSFVFVDDNPFERELVRKMLPAIAVPEMPANPALYTRTLSAAGYFEAAAYLQEDRDRAGYYEGNARRAALQKNVGDLDGYLASLKMEIQFQPFDETGRARITQLINKSNQFNLTTRRHTEADVARMESNTEYFTLQVRLADAFGDNGMIGVVICRAEAADGWEIDTWLMSCRVLGRCVEQMVLRELLEHASARGIRRLVGVFRPTGRNKLVEHHYSKLGFTPLETQPDGVSTWKLEVAGARIPAAPMVVRSLGFELKPRLAAASED